MKQNAWTWIPYFVAFSTKVYRRMRFTSSVGFSQKRSSLVFLTTW